MKKLRKVIFSLPYRRYHLCVPLSSEELQQILQDLSITGIEEKYKYANLILGSFKTLYYVKIIDSNYFSISGPVAQKRLCLLTQGSIKTSLDSNKAVIVELEIKIAERQILELKIVLLFYLIFAVFMTVLVSISWAFLAFIHLILIAIVWSGGIAFNFQVESDKLITILRQKFKCQ